MRKQLALLALLLMTFFPLSAETTAASVESSTAIQSFVDYMNSPEMYFFLSDTHYALGYTSAALGLSACIFNPSWVDKDIHEAFGSAAAITSILNMGIGLWNYHERVTSGLSGKGSSSDVWHALMAIVGSSLMIAAVAVADDDGGGSPIHPWLGGIGAGLMSAAILFEF